MTFWHGTTIENAEKIKQEGLRPQPTKKYDILVPFVGTLRDVEGPEVQDYVYLTTHKDLAEFYADFRTRYERTQRGRLFDKGGIPVMKLAGEADPNARPAILRVELPAEIEAKLIPDKQDWREAYTFTGQIAPEFIKEVIAL